MKFWKEIINRQAAGRRRKLGTGFGINEYVGFWAPRRYHELPHPTQGGEFNAIVITGDSYSTKGGIMAAYGLNMNAVGNWSSFLHAKIKEDYTSEMTGIVGDQGDMAYLWGFYLKALDAGKKATDMDLLSKDKFVKMCFDFRGCYKQDNLCG